METEQQKIIDISEQTKVKDPKKVAAGKALARKNAEARAAFKQSEATQATQATQDFESEKENKSLSFSDVSNRIQSTAAIVGACLVLYQGWNLLSPYMNDKYKSPLPPSPPQPARGISNKIRI